MMKKMILKPTALLCAMSSCLLMSSYAPLSAKAITLSADAPMPVYTMYLAPERTFVSAEELAAGAVHIRTDVYIQGNADIDAKSFMVRYGTDSDRVYFDNSRNLPSDPNTDADENPIFQTYHYSGGTFSTEYSPFCFSMIDDAGKFSNETSFINTTASTLTEPYSGSILLSDGNGGVYFGRDYSRLDANGEVERIQHEQVKIPADQLTIHPNGSASFTYTYYAQEPSLGYPLMENTITIPCYEPELPAEAPVKGENNVYLWFINPQYEDVDFLGYSDEFPCFSFDIVLRQGTTEGEYSVTLDKNNCFLSCNVQGKSSPIRLPLTLVGTTITVGNPTGSITTDPTSPYYCFSADETQPLPQLLGATESNVISCNAAPSELYSAGNQAVFTDTVQIYSETDGITEARILVGKSGDTDLNGSVTVEDAAAVLQYYAKAAAGVDSALFTGSNAAEAALSCHLADMDGNGTLSVEDAVQILNRYAQQSAGQL